MLLCLLAFLVALPSRTFPEDRLLLDRRLETLRRILPDGPNPTGDSGLVRELANASRLQSVESAARPPVESATAGYVPVDLTATGRFGDVERFFRQVALSARLIDVETLALTAAPADSVRLTALLDLPYRPAKAPLPPAPDGTRAKLAGVAKPQADAYVRDVALSVAKSEAIASLRRARRNPRLFLCELAAVVRDRPVTLNFASLADDFVVRGQTVGEGPVRALEGRFERGFLRVSDFLMRRGGACVQFEVRGKSPVAGADAELPLPSEDPFAQDDAPCRVDRDQGRSVMVKGAPPNPKAPPKGALTLRLRDVDLADVFLVLHSITGQAFVVDADVVARASVELAGVGLDEALAALQKQAGLRVSEFGSIRRVSNPAGRPLPRSAPDPGGPPASFKLKRAEVRDVLAAMTDVDAGLAALGPQGAFGKVSLWTRDTPLFTVRGALLESAGLQERSEDGRRLLERPGSPGDPLLPVAGQGDPPRLVSRPHDLVAAEFELVGVASGGDAFWAFAYSPAGTLNAYRAGDKLADGSVKSVDSTDVVLETDEGPIRLLVPPAPR